MPRGRPRKFDTKSPLASSFRGKAKTMGPSDFDLDESGWSEEEDQDIEKEKVLLQSKKLATIPGCLEQHATNSSGDIMVHSGRMKCTLTQKGYEVLEDHWAMGRDKHTVSSVLGCTNRQLQTIFEEDEEAREARDRGKGRFKDRLTDDLMWMSSRGNTTATTWLEKSLLGINPDREVAAPPQAHVHLYLPESMTREEAFKGFIEAHESLHKPAALPEAVETSGEEIQPEAAALVESWKRKENV